MALGFLKKVFSFGQQCRGRTDCCRPASSRPTKRRPPAAAVSTESPRHRFRRAVCRRRLRSPEPEAPRTGWFQRLSEGLSRSSRELTGNIAGVFTKRKLDEETLQDLEDVLIRADLGMETALRDHRRAVGRRATARDVSDADVRAIMAAEIEKVLVPVAKPLELDLSHQAARHPGGRRQRHRQDHDDRQARRQADRAAG